MFLLDSTCKYLVTKPLKLIGILGGVCIAISLILLIYIIVNAIGKFNYLSVSWPIITAITFFSGVQLMTTWIISEYIGRIYDESKKRPQYIVDKKINIE